MARKRETRGSGFVTRDEETDEEEVARGRGKDRGSDVDTRRLVSPGDSKRPAGFSRSAKTVKLTECDPGNGTNPETDLVH